MSASDARRTVLALLLGVALASGCKSKKESEEARQARAVIEGKADLRERLRKNKIARKERQEWLKRHPEVLSAPIDPSHRPTAEPSPNIPPQLLGATPAPRPPEPPPSKKRRAR